MASIEFLSRLISTCSRRATVTRHLYRTARRRTSQSTPALARHQRDSVGGELVDEHGLECLYALLRETLELTDDGPCLAGQVAVSIMLPSAPATL